MFTRKLLTAVAVVTGSVGSAQTLAPPGGTYDCPQIITIRDFNPTATIFYTTDGSAPTPSSTKYQGPITVDHTEKVSAVAVVLGGKAGDVERASYTCTSTLSRGDFAVLLQKWYSLPPPQTPITLCDVSPGDGDYSAVQAVSALMNSQFLCPTCFLKPCYSPNAPVTRDIGSVALMRILIADKKIKLLSLTESEEVLEDVPDAKTLPMQAWPDFATAIQSGILRLSGEERDLIQPGLPYTGPDIAELLAYIQRKFGVPKQQEDDHEGR